MHGTLLRHHGSATLSWWWRLDCGAAATESASRVFLVASPPLTAVATEKQIISDPLTEYLQSRGTLYCRVSLVEI
jgi:hypothetical protein